jgi:hypothetical protein
VEGLIEQVFGLQDSAFESDIVLVVVVKEADIVLVAVVQVVDIVPVAVVQAVDKQFEAVLVE